MEFLSHMESIGLILSEKDKQLSKMKELLVHPIFHQKGLRFQLFPIFTFTCQGFFLSFSFFFFFYFLLFACLPLFKHVVVFQLVLIHWQMMLNTVLCNYWSFVLLPL